jgi:hypothetical protein
MFVSASFLKSAIVFWLCERLGFFSLITNFYISTSNPERTEHMFFSVPLCLKAKYSVPMLFCSPGSPNIFFTGTLFVPASLLKSEVVPCNAGAWLSSLSSPSSISQPHIPKYHAQNQHIFSLAVFKICP